MTIKLFAVYLGGRAPKANTELHDMVFATGARIEDTYSQLLDKWFGDPHRLHLDAWIELDVVDGYRVNLSETAGVDRPKLFFVNLGAYRPGELTERHAVGFYAAADALEAKKRALATLFKSGEHERHKDDLLDVDDCIALDTVGDLHVVLTKTGEASDLKAHNGYHIIPKDVVAAYLAKSA